VLRIDLTPVVDAVLDSLPGRYVADDVTVPEASFPVAEASSEIDDLRTVYQRIDGLGTAIPLVCAALLIAAVGVSPLRRRTVLVTAALALPVLGLTALAMLGLRSLLEAAADPGEERELLLAVWDALAAGLWEATIVTAVVAALVLVLGLLTPRLWRSAGGDAPEQIGTATPGAR
jgi:hypothetical protein